MLVGAGGNAGNQASVRVIRGLALGTLNEQTQGQFLTRELKMASALSIILSLAGFARASVFRTPLPETIAVTAALAMIVFSSVCLGAILPLILKKLRVDPGTYGEEGPLQLLLLFLSFSRCCIPYLDFFCFLYFSKLIRVLQFKLLWTYLELCLPCWYRV